MAQFNKLTAIAAFGFASWYGGQLTERHNLLKLSKDETSTKQFSIFGSVLAATPFIRNDQPVSIGNRLNQIMNGYPSLENIRVFDDYVLSYDRRNRIPSWTFEHLSKDGIKRDQDVDRAKCEFMEDNSIHNYFRSTNEDYKRSGYDRGHLAAAGNHMFKQSHCDQTFYLSNIAPQVGVGFNRHSWNRLEKHVRKQVRKYKNVYVCTGPLFLPRKAENNKMIIQYEVIGNNHVAVPTHFFKVILLETAQGTYELESYMMPNKPIDDSTPLYVFQVDTEPIERSAGFLIFDELSKSKLKKINGKVIK